MITHSGCLNTEGALCFRPIGPGGGSYSKSAAGPCSLPWPALLHAAWPNYTLPLFTLACHRDVEQDIIPVLRELGIGIVAYSPLGRGFLTGTITSLDDLPADDRRHDFPRFKKGAFEKVRIKQGR